ncbi:MAG: Re/Si-specific transhydrogenase subunit alpha [Bacteroidota bacterium]|nr:Re/Si-specific transhydrogenase subunit alpha [Bacteroidota bacterium]
MIIGLLKEKEGEHRVSILPDVVVALVKIQAKVWAEHGAGFRSFEKDEDYTQAGAEVKSREDILSQSDIILSIHSPEFGDIVKMKNGAVLVGIYQPLYHFAIMKDWAEKNITSFSLDMLPRTSRAQTMDVLSSQASITGYKALVVAASVYPKYLPMMMTAAGTIAPAKVLILGAGVAGLQAIATAKRMGSVVEVFDTRPAVKEEVMSLGAKFIEVEGAADPSKAGGYAVEQTEEYKNKQKQRIHDAIVKADIVITTAQIPGKRAPILITQSMVDGMKAGSVIVDIAAATGGNCELTRDNETVLYNGVTIIGNSHLASTMPSDASKLYGKNVLNFIKLIIDSNGALNLNFEDDLVKGACITHNKTIVNERVKEMAANN